MTDTTDELLPGAMPVVEEVAPSPSQNASPFKDGLASIGRASLGVLYAPVDLTGKAIKATGDATNTIVAEVSGAAAAERRKKDNSAATALQAATRGLQGRVAAKEKKVETKVPIEARVEAAASGIDFALKRQQTAKLAELEKPSSDGGMMKMLLLLLPLLVVALAVGWQLQPEDDAPPPTSGEPHMLKKVLGLLKKN